MVSKPGTYLHGFGNHLELSGCKTNKQETNKQKRKPSKKTNKQRTYNRKNKPIKYV